MAASRADPRSEAEKARADLKRNTEMGGAVSESPLEHQPSVTPETFGAHGKAARMNSGIDQGVEAGGPSPAGRAGGEESIVEAPQVAAGRDSTRAAPQRGDADAPTRPKT
jgi:hypothetical protein